MRRIGEQHRYAGTSGAARGGSGLTLLFAAAQVRPRLRPVFDSGPASPPPEREHQGRERVSSASRPGQQPPLPAVTMSLPSRVARDEQTPTVSIVFPALNEAAAIGQCVERARAALGRGGWRGEVVVVDNGSTDRTAEVARGGGARVVTEARRGYGAACLRRLTDATGGVVLPLDPAATYSAELARQFVPAVPE